MATRPPAYHRKGKDWHADSCRPLVEAAEAGHVEFEALARGQYPGRPLPKRALNGVRTVGYWDARKAQTWGLEYHRNEGIEFTFLETGRMPFTLGKREFTLAPGDFTVTRPWQSHRVGDPCIGIGRLHWAIIDVGVRHPHQDWQWPDWVVLSPSDLEELTRLLRHNERPVWRAASDTKHCFTRIAEAVALPRPADAMSRMAVHLNELLILTLDMLRKPKLTLDETLTSSARSVELFFEELRGRLDEPWTIPLMAENCGLGVTRFVHHCKQVTNRTPADHLNWLRAEAAARMLTGSPEMTVTEISFACGFSSSQYFATVFKRLHGCSPSDYRAQNAS